MPHGESTCYRVLPLPRPRHMHRMRLELGLETRFGLKSGLGLRSVLGPMASCPHLDGRLEHHGAIHLRQHATIRTHGSNHINQPRLQAPAHCSRRVAAHASRIIDMPERTGGMCRQRRIQRNRERGTHHHECGHSRAWSWHGFGRSIIWDGRVSPAAGIIHGNPSVTPRERYRPLPKES